MDIQLRKIHFVKEFLRINNEQVIDKLESLLKSEKERIYSEMPEPMSIEDLNSIIDKAESDAKQARTTSAHDLKKDIQSWS